MPKPQTILNWVYGVCFFALAAIFMFVPSVKAADGDLMSIKGVWGVVILGLVAIGLVASFAAMILGFVRRRRLKTAAWPSVPILTLRDQDEAPRYRELLITFDRETDTWIFSNDATPIAAFRQLVGRVEDELNVFGQFLNIDRPRLRSGGILMRDGKEIASGGKTLLTDRIEIAEGNTVYSIRPLFFAVFRRRYRMTADGSDVAQFRYLGRKQWRIHDIRKVDARLLVFGFWLIMQSISREGK